MDNTNLQDPVIQSASEKEKISKIQTGYLPPDNADLKTVSKAQKNIGIGFKFILLVL